MFAGREEGYRDERGGAQLEPKGFANHPLYSEGEPALTVFNSHYLYWYLQETMFLR